LSKKDLSKRFVPKVKRATKEKRVAGKMAKLKTSSWYEGAAEGCPKSATGEELKLADVRFEGAAQMRYRLFRYATRIAPSQPADMIFTKHSRSR
jgi:hypothetical protein